MKLYGYNFLDFLNIMGKKHYKLRSKDLKGALDLDGKAIRNYDYYFTELRHKFNVLCAYFARSAFRNSQLKRIARLATVSAFGLDGVLIT